MENSNFDHNENPEGTLQHEANYVKQDISFAVEFVDISTVLPYEEEVVYLNLETKEREKYCIELTSQGFHIVGRKYDTIEDENATEYYETIYALLDSISPQYRQLFGESLVAKLSAHVQPACNGDDDFPMDG